MADAYATWLSSQWFGSDWADVALDVAVALDGEVTVLVREAPVQEVLGAVVVAELVAREVLAGRVLVDCECDLVSVDVAAAVDEANCVCSTGDRVSG
jgi:hypothetical protein